MGLTMGRKRQINRHPQKALSARRVQTLHAPGRYADGGALYLHIRASGSRSWLLRTTINGAVRDLGLGGTSVVSLADAREEAARLRKVARTGGDPRVERRRRVVPTFVAAATHVHAIHSAGFRNAKHKAQWLSSLHPVIEAVGQQPVNVITSADLLNVLTPTWLTRPETSRRVLQRLGVIFDWCKAQGYCPGDLPTLGLTRALPKQRPSKAHHAALPYSELPDFLRTLRASDAGKVVTLAFELLILTATRTSEVLGAQWAEVDLNEKVWTIPATRMKASVEHRVPLSPRCCSLLRQAQALSDGGPYVFPGRSPSKALSNMSLLMTLRRMGRSDITSHGFRSTFRDWAAERTNVPRAVCEAALAHTVRDKTEAAYHRTDLFDRRRKLMESWAAFATGRKAQVLKLRA